MNLHNFTSGARANRVQQPLTMDELRKIAPSAFAMEKHSSRSDRYAYIPTSDVIEGMMRNGFQPFKATQSRSRIEGKTEYTKHMIRFRSQDAITPMVVGDTVPEVVLINSHDGTSTYQLSAGFYRLVCSNGLMVSEGMQDSIRIPHKGNIIDAVIEGSNRIVNGSGAAIATIENWNSLQLTAGEQQAFAEAAHQIRFADSDGSITTPITAAQLLTPRRSEDRNRNTWTAPIPDLWHTLNVVQENVIRGGISARAPRTPQARGRMVTTHAVKGIDADARLNRALWTLAERMAELKGARVAA